jgi:magnesium chelatase accessory protein
LSVGRATFWDREKRFWPHADLSRFVAAAGIRWHVQQAGSGPPMLLVHGTGASVHSWRDLLPAFAADYTVLAVDLPGHAFTEAAAAARYSLHGMSESLAELLQRLGFSPAYCVGHSAGAAILCRMALDRRITPRRIVSLNGAFLPLGGAAGVFFSPIARLFAGTTLVPRLISWRGGEALAVDRVIQGTGSKLDRRGIDLYARLVREPQHIAGALGMMGSWNLHSFERDLSRLETPVTLIAAGNDRAVPPAQARRIEAHLPQASLVHVPGLGHLAHEEAPQRFVGLVREAFTSLCV